MSTQYSVFFESMALNFNRVTDCAIYTSGNRRLEENKEIQFSSFCCARARQWRWEFNTDILDWEQRNFFVVVTHRTGLNKLSSICQSTPGACVWNMNDERDKPTKTTEAVSLFLYSIVSCVSSSVAADENRRVADKIWLKFSFSDPKENNALCSVLISGESIRNMHEDFVFWCSLSGNRYRPTLARTISMRDA